MADRLTHNAVANLAKLEILDLDTRPYSEVWELQRTAQKNLIANGAPELLIVCEHAPVITVGKSGGLHNLLVSQEELKNRGVELFEVERGGDITYHGPGQLVAYPILDLNTKKRDVAWYMRALEEVIIQTLQEFEIKGIRIPGKTGVWTQHSENAIDFKHSAGAERKIASLGVRISRWCSMHGVALNVADCRAGFGLINPCGFTGIEMTSIAQESSKSIAMPLVREKFIEKFVSVFEFKQVTQNCQAASA